MKLRDTHLSAVFAQNVTRQIKRAANQNTRLRIRFAMIFMTMRRQTLSGGGRRQIDLSAAAAAVSSALSVAASPGIETAVRLWALFRQRS